MKCLCYLGILKDGFSAYSSPVILIDRKLIKDKRVVTDLGSSKFEVLSVLHLKDAFHSLRLSEHSKKYCRILPLLW